MRRQIDLEALLPAFITEEALETLVGRSTVTLAFCAITGVAQEAAEGARRGCCTIMVVIPDREEIFREGAETQRTGLWMGAFLPGEPAERRTFLEPVPIGGLLRLFLNPVDLRLCGQAPSIPQVVGITDWACAPR